MTWPSPAPDERMVATASLGETLAALRVLSDEAVRPMRQSLELHGQLTALATYRDDDDTLQVIDGFTRLRAARALGWGELRVRVLPIDVVAATAALATRAPTRPRRTSACTCSWRPSASVSRRHTQLLSCPSRRPTSGGCHMTTSRWPRPSRSAAG